MSRYLALRDILAFHADLIARFGGTLGVRDQGALESAVARPQNGYYSDIIEEAAALWESLSQNHPFLDGNKRTAITATAIFLRMNGYRLSFTDADAYQWLMKQYETGTLKKTILEDWLRQRVLTA